MCRGSTTASAVSKGTSDCLKMLATRKLDVNEGRTVVVVSVDDCGIAMGE